MSLLALQNITVAYGGPALLDGVDLNLESGDRLCLVGRNGCGKSSFLNLVAGELSPDGGRIVRQQGLRIALLPQEVPPGLAGTVFDVVAGGMGTIFTLLREYHDLAGASGAGGADLTRMAVLQQRLEEQGGWHLHLNVERVLARLSLDSDDEFARLSGGTKRRVLLARALVSDPDILLLDEPTNHLDIETIDWLEEFLLKNIRTLVFVTHDRAFARRIANRVAEIDRGQVVTFSCGYDDFIDRREALLDAEATRRALFDKKLAQEESWVRQGIKARRTRNEGRVRALKKMREERLARRDRDGRVRMNLEETERSGQLVADVEGVGFGYGPHRVINNFSTTIMRGDRIGIIGANGTGKTTLLRLLLGELAPQEGTLRLGTRRQVVYFDQLRDQLDLNSSVADNVGEGNDTVVVNGRSRHVIGYLQDFLFSPERARSPVNILSGGERNRLLLAKLFTRPCNILVMDEPTNDLDMDTLDLLEELLLDFKGTLLLVSHDREFLNNVVTSTLFLKGDGSVQEFVGGYDDWQREAKAAMVAPAAQPGGFGRKARNSDSRPRKLTYKEERELEALPDKIDALEKQRSETHRLLSDPDLYRNAGDRVAQLTEQLKEVERALEADLLRWEQLETIRNS